MTCTVIRATTPTLTPPPSDIRAQFEATDGSIEAHDRLMAGLPSMVAVETGGKTPHREPLAFPVRVAAWNVERCLFVEDSVEKLSGETVDLVLVSEMDCGMARSGQRHTTAELADQLGMAYAYGVEFIEMGLGSPTEREFCRDDHNQQGFHGNGLLSKNGLSSPFIVRLWGERIWRQHDPAQPRIGDRCAVGGLVETASGPIVAVSVHLESAASAAYRERQMRELIDTIDRNFAGLPVLIGGDLNTGNHAGGDFEAEGLFAMGAARGFQRHGGPIDQMTTRPSLISRWPERAMKLDWFLSRGLTVDESWIIPSTDASGRPLSDHDLIACRITGFSAR